MSLASFFLLFAAAGVFLVLVLLFLKRDRKVRQLERDLRETEKRLEERFKDVEEERNRVLAMIEGMVEGMIVIDPDQRIILVNSSLAKTFGHSKAEMMNRCFWEIFRDPGLNEFIQKGLEKRLSLREEHALFMMKSVVDVQISPVFSGDHFLGAVAVFHDVTRLKELEKMRTDFVANVSHELKTPLTSIMGFVETLKEGAVEDPKNRGRFLKIIEEHSEKLKHLIDELLLLSKVESGHEEIVKEDVDLEKMIESLMRSFQKPLDAKRIRFRTEFESQPFRISAAPKIFEQALSNLLDNAIKYNTEKGEITVKAYARDRQSFIEVGDTGLGIPPEDLPRVFERFYRVDKSRSRELGGSGLGLSIVKHIAERHGGKIVVSSTPNKGSVFTLVLPQ